MVMNFKSNSDGKPNLNMKPSQQKLVMDWMYGVVPEKGSPVRVHTVSNERDIKNSFPRNNAA
jgi:hypothetical protein